MQTMKGYCADCKKLRRVRKDMLVAVHYVGDRRCPGSERSPASVKAFRVPANTTLVIGHGLGGVPPGVKL